MFPDISDSQLRFPNSAETVENMYPSSIWYAYWKEIIFNLCHFVDKITGDRLTQ